VIGVHGQVDPPSVARLAGGGDEAHRNVAIEGLAWIPMRGVPANKMKTGSKIGCCVVVLVIGFTPRSAEATGRRYPRTSRKRLFPSHGTATSVSSNPEAISSGLWARFWNRTTISRSVIVTFAEASMKSRNKWRDLADS